MELAWTEPQALRDDPYAVTARGEIYLLHGEGDNTFRRRVWSIHRSPLRNP